MNRRRFRGDGGRPGSSSTGRISPPRDPPRRSSGDRRRQPPLSKAEIFFEAGRLAAEYLVSKGVLPPESLPGECREFKSSLPSGKSAMPPATSFSYPKRRYGDAERDRPVSRDRNGGKRKLEYPDRRRGGSDWGEWGRPRGRERRRWMERARGSSEDEDDDYAPGFQRRRWRGGSGEVESVRSRASAAEEMNSWSEVTGESGSERSRFLNSEMGEEVRSHDTIEQLKERRNVDRDSSFVAHKVFDGYYPGTSKEAERSSGNSHVEKTRSAKYHSSDNSVRVVKPMLEPVSRQDESCQIPPGRELPGLVVDEAKCSTYIDRREEIIKSEGEAPPSRVSPETEKLLLDNLKAPESDEKMNEAPPSRVSPQIQKFHLDNLKAPDSGEKVNEAVDHEQPSGDAVLLNCGAESVVKMDTEKQLRCPLFKTFDLNLMGSPERTHTPDDPIMDQQPLSPVNAIGNDNDCRKLLHDDTASLPVTVLENESPAKDTSCSSSKSKSEAICESHERVPDHTLETNGLSNDISVLLGGNISRCPSIQANLNNLQLEMTLNNEEVP